MTLEAHRARVRRLERRAGLASTPVTARAVTEADILDEAASDERYHRAAHEAAFRSGRACPTCDECPGCTDPNCGGGVLAGGGS